MAKIINTSGKRKRAIARASLKDGTGVVKVNGVLLDVYQPEMYRMRLQEPLILAGDVAKVINIIVKVSGGGMASQADAVRLAIGRALAKYSKKLEKVLLNYDRQLLVADIRRKEASKPNCQGSARSKRQKSYR